MIVKSKYQWCKRCGTKSISLSSYNCCVRAGKMEGFLLSAEQIRVMPNGDLAIALDFEKDPNDTQYRLFTPTQDCFYKLAHIFDFVLNDYFEVNPKPAVESMNRQLIDNPSWKFKVISDGNRAIDFLVR